jgi:peptide/nickel transport system substrate-binding protein
MANQAGYQDNSGEVGAYNPENARNMLDGAGWMREGNVRKKGGTLLDVTFVIPGGIATSKQVAELVQNMVGQVGIQLEIKTVPINDFFDKYITPGQFDLTFFSWFGTPYPVSSAKSLYAAPRKNAKGELEIQQNYARVGSEEIDRLFDQANGELDRRKAKALANRLDSLIWQEVHSLAMYQRPELYACKKGLANFGAFGFEIPWVYQDIGWTK